MGYIRGSERGQHILFPSTLDEYLEEANPVRVIAAFVGVLDFEQLGFVRGKAAATGRPGYDPRLLLGLFIWGHLNKVRSSRKLERESGRNLEAMWLLENLQPDFTSSSCPFFMSAVGSVHFWFTSVCALPSALPPSTVRSNFHNPLRKPGNSSALAALAKATTHTPAPARSRTFRLSIWTLGLLIALPYVRAG